MKEWRPMNRRQFEEIRRWGDKLRSDEREEMRAAGEAIRLLSEEIERIGRELWSLATRLVPEPLQAVEDLEDVHAEPAAPDARGAGHIGDHDQARHRREAGVPGRVVRRAVALLDVAKWCGSATTALPSCSRS